MNKLVVNNMRTTLLLVWLLIVSIAYGQVDERVLVSKVMELRPTPEIKEIKQEANYEEFEYWCNDSLIEVGIDYDIGVVFTETEWGSETFSDHGLAINELLYVNLPDTSLVKIDLKNKDKKKLYIPVNVFEQNEITNTSGDYQDIIHPTKVHHSKNTPYNFLNPDKIFNMPETLKEISGIAWSDDNTLYCVQDEEGTIFIFNTRKSELSGTLQIFGKGDYEDIAIVGDKVYVVRSDGTLFYFNHRNFTGEYEQIQIPINCTDIEGLCFDKSGKSFLISCKDQSINENESYRLIYTFSKENKHKPEIAFTIDIDEIRAMLNARYPDLTKEKIKFNPSAIAVHPLTKETYVLSANDRMLAIYLDKKLIDIFPLPKELYFQPEGLDFTQNGDLFIASEGKKKGQPGGKIFYFKWIR